MFNNPERTLRQIRFPEEVRVIKSIMESIEHNFGFNFMVSNGHVVEVQLISAGIAIIPRQLKELPFLTTLQLPSNHLKKLRNLERCTNLSTLNLQDNHLTSEVLGPISKITHLKSLDLSQNRIKSWANLDNLSDLEILNLSGNSINEIPRLHLPNLKILDLRENPITELKNLHFLENLIEIRLDKARFSVEEQGIIEKGLQEVKNYCKSKE